MQLTDTHCHIHESSYPLDPEVVLRHARNAGVDQLICVGTSEKSSREAVLFAAEHADVFASVGVHPHDTKDGWNIEEFAEKPEVVAVGEIGLDYFYTHSPREIQIEGLQAQIEVALKHNVPIIFHVREAFDDFWPIFDNFHGIRGELHSFTDTKRNLEEGLKRGLYVGVNGISTFTKSESQKEMFAAIPLRRLLLETDAPFLTPVPLRGKVNEPAYVMRIAEHHARIHSISLEEVAATTTANAKTLFTLS